MSGQQAASPLRPVSCAPADAPRRPEAAFWRCAGATTRCWAERSAQRMALRALLLEGEPERLHDLGLTPAQAWREARKWFWQQ